MADIRHRSEVLDEVMFFDNEPELAWVDGIVTTVEELRSTLAWLSGRSR